MSALSTVLSQTRLASAAFETFREGPSGALAAHPISFRYVFQWRNVAFEMERLLTVVAAHQIWAGKVQKVRRMFR